MEGWRRFVFETDEDFQESIKEYPDSHRFNLGSSGVQIWGGQRKKAQQDNPRSARSRGAFSSANDRTGRAAPPSSSRQRPRGTRSPSRRDTRREERPTRRTSTESNLSRHTSQVRGGGKGKKGQEDRRPPPNRSATASASARPSSVSPARRSSSGRGDIKHTEDYLKDLRRKISRTRRDVSRKKERKRESSKQRSPSEGKRERKKNEEEDERMQH